MNPQVTAYLGYRLGRLPDDPDRSLTELRIEPTSLLWHGTTATPTHLQGRAVLRQRVAVEHDLAHIGHWQGRRARYRGTRNNLFDLRRTAVVHNLHVIARNGTFDQQVA